MSNLQPHIKVESVDQICFLSGNPDRVPIIASHLNDSMKVAEHRGLIAFRGYSPKKNVPVTILTTGMGSGSSGIILEEAYRAGARIFIRIGSTGALISDMEVGIGTIFIPYAAIRDEGTSKEFIPSEVPAVADPQVFQGLCKSAKDLGIKFQNGLVWSTDIYYSENPKRHIKWTKYYATCVEMESSTLFSFCLSKKDKLKAGTILTADGNLNFQNNIYNNDIKRNNEIFQEGIGNSIKIAIKTIEDIDISE